ncbi:HNH endonuclease [Stenotrophomonas sp. ATCM1_4]|nr:HNH endonuclease [Stenotrophomonas sp. ATCM1_4]
MQRMAPVHTPPVAEPQRYGNGRGGRPWRRLRDRILVRDRYLCQCGECQAGGLPLLADEVDHIIPIAEGGTDEESNLQAMSSVCHAKKTAEEAGRGSRRRVESDSTR